MVYYETKTHSAPLSANKCTKKLDIIHCISSCDNRTAAAAAATTSVVETVSVVISDYVNQMMMMMLVMTAVMMKTVGNSFIV